MRGDGSDVPGTARPLFVVAAGIAVLAAIGILVGAPTPYSPLSMAVAIPTLLGGRVVGVLTVPLVFLATGFPLWRRTVGSPWPSFALTVLVVVLSALWHLEGWSYAVRHQGHAHAVIVTMENVIVGAVVVWFSVRFVRSRSFSHGLASHGVLGAWLAWSAFPWFGELL